AVSAASVESSGVWATLIGVVMLLVGASAVFGELQDALNTIWEAKPSPNAGLWDLVKKRLLSVAMVAVIGFLLLVSLTISAVLNAIGGYLGSALPIPSFLLELLNTAISFGVISILFAALFKVLPDIDSDWGDVWIGAMATAALFTVGKSL